MRSRPGRSAAAIASSLVLTMTLLAACGTQAKTSGGATSASPATSDPARTAPARRGPTAPSTTTSTPGATSSPGPPTLVTKLVVLMVENHSLDQMRGRMPFTAGLADRYAYADHYTAIRHPSLPNYLAILGGSTFGVGDDDAPRIRRVRGTSIFGAAIAHGRTARLYAEGMPSRCATSDGGQQYAVKHNPWAYFVDERGQCRTDDVPLDALTSDVTSGQLPNAAMIIPDLCNDAHDCDLPTADRWLRERISELTSGPDWTSGRLAIVVTADEDDHHQSNTVLTAVLQRDLRHRVVHTALTHYSLSRLYAEVLGVQPLREAARAPSMATAFGLRVRAATP